MRIPQDRILHIDTELKDGKVNITAEWQGELVRCKDCRHSDTTGVYLEGLVYCKWFNTSCVKNGYCHRGECKGGEEE